MMYGLYNGYWGYGMGFMGVIMMWVFWGLIIWAVVSLVRGRGKDHHMYGDDHNMEGKDNSPLNILKERYARGEIDKNEFEEKKKDLS